MKFYLMVEVVKTDGGRQDWDIVGDALDEAITDIGDIYAQDDDHEEESTYEIREVRVDRKRIESEAANEEAAV